jgi:hypothetical protein
VTRRVNLRDLRAREARLRDLRLLFETQTIQTSGGVASACRPKADADVADRADLAEAERLVAELLRSA